MSVDDQPQDSPMEPFTLTREMLAQLLAADASGFPDAIPETEDFELADELLKVIDRRYFD